MRKAAYDRGIAFNKKHELGKEFYGKVKLKKNPADSNRLVPVTLPTINLHEPNWD